MAPELVTSKNNQRVKNIRKLRSRPERDRSGIFLVEGIRQVSEAIKSGAEIVDLLVAPDLLRSEFALELVSVQQDRGIDTVHLAPDVFQSISERDRPQGLAAVVRQRWTNLDDLAVGSDSLWVALESVADPGNLGTILRTTDAVGAHGVIVLGQSTDPFDPGAVRASMGAAFTLKIVRTSGAELVVWARKHRVRLAGTSPDATTDYQAVDYHSPLVLLMGSERQGLSDELLRACDPLVRLPMSGTVDSLNLAVATGVVLYEIYNQRRSIEQRESGDEQGRSRSRRRATSNRGARPEPGRPATQGRPPRRTQNNQNRQ